MYRAKPVDGIVWITGASSGIGRGVALELLRRGFKVAVTARRSEELEALAREAGGGIYVFTGDVTDVPAMAAMVEAIEDAHGPIALAFLNAGGNFRDAPDDPCGENFRRTLDLNINGALNCLGPLVKRMRLRGRGQIALTASVAGYAGMPGAAAYCASKAAMITLGESLHVDLAAFGINLQVVCPGYVRTPLTERADYPKPFMVELDDAVQRICDGFERKGFEIAFPRRMALLLKIFTKLPAPVFFWIVRQGNKKALK